MRARRTYVEPVPEDEEPIAVVLHHASGCFGVVLLGILLLLAIVAVILIFK